MYWECDRCGTVHTQNPDECRDCSHHIFTPVSADEVQNRSSGTESPQAMSDVPRGSSTVDPEYESSPDVSIDGSLADSQSKPATNSTDSGPGTVRQFIYKLRGTVIAPFRLVREWIIPITVFVLVFGGVLYLLFI
jgi:hypothetical protein